MLHCKKDQGFEINALHSAWEVRDDFISTSSLKVFQEEKWIFISIKEERKKRFPAEHELEQQLREPDHV